MIDIHTHILPEKLPRWKERFGYGGFIDLDHHAPCRARMLRDDGKFFREIESNCWDPQVRLEDCQRFGVSRQVLSTVPVMFSYWAKPQHTHDLARFLNDHIAAVVAANPTRFEGLATLPMQDPELACLELRRSVQELGLRGVQIATHIRAEGFDWNLDDPGVCEVFAEAERLNACIFVHPWDMMGEASMPRYWLPWLVGMPAEVSRAICSMIFGGVFERYPKLRVAFAHGGGSFPSTLGRIQHGFESRPDLCGVSTQKSPEAQKHSFYLDTLVHDPRTLRFLIETFGVEKLALGTDYPFPLGESKPGALIQTLDQLSKGERDRLLVGTAEEWLQGRHQ